MILSPEIGWIQDLAISPDGSQVALYETTGIYWFTTLPRGRRSILFKDDGLESRAGLVA